MKLENLFKKEENNDFISGYHLEENLWNSKWNSSKCNNKAAKESSMAVNGEIYNANLIHEGIASI